MSAVTMPGTVIPPEESVYDLGQRLSEILAECGQTASGGEVPEAIRDRVADIVEAIRRRIARRAERDLRSLFDLDDRFIELMDRADAESEEPGGVSETLLREITDYIEAFRNKVDRIAGYLRWQESIAAICAEEAERLAARKKAAAGRVTRLKAMLLAFMKSRGSKKLEGETSSINMQSNSNPSLVVDDPLKIGEAFYERDFRITKTELQEILHQLVDGELRRRLEHAIHSGEWKINTSAVRAAIMNSAGVEGARLVKGDHVRVR